jgi:hypothetical protein
LIEKVCKQLESRRLEEVWRVVVLESSGVDRAEVWRFRKNLVTRVTVVEWPLRQKGGWGCGWLIFIADLAMLRKQSN